MVNPLVYHLASGQAFFSGVALVLLALSLSTRVRGRWVAFARTLAACMGLVLIAASATPLPAWFYAGALTLSFVWLVAEGSTRGGSAGWKLWVRLAVGAV